MLFCWSFTDWTLITNDSLSLFKTDSKPAGPPPGLFLYIISGTDNIPPTTAKTKPTTASVIFAVNVDIGSKLVKKGITIPGAKNNDANITIPNNIKTVPKPIFNQDTSVLLLLFSLFWLLLLLFSLLMFRLLLFSSSLLLLKLKLRDLYDIFSLISQLPWTDSLSLSLLLLSFFV